MRYKSPPGEALFDHLEHFLGPIRTGWTHAPDGTKLPFQVLSFDTGPVIDTMTLCTVGLSHHQLPTGVDGSNLRQEIVMCGWKNSGLREFPGALMMLAMEVIRRHEALIAPIYADLHGPLFDGKSMEAFFVIDPVLYPREFRVVHLDNGDHVQILWAIPILREEVEHIKKRGHDEFYRKLKEQKVDVFSLDRPAADLA